MQDSEGHNKLKCDDNRSQNRIETMILQLSSQFNNMSNRLDTRISELETNFEERVSEKLSVRLSEMIDNKIGDKITEVKSEVKGELDEMKSKLDNMEKKLSENKHQDNNSKLRFVIKNLEFDEREKTEPTLTQHKVKGLLKDCLGLKNICLMSVERIETKGRYPGAIIAETNTIESKKEIMKNKSKLKHNRNHSKVYI